MVVIIFMDISFKNEESSTEAVAANLKGSPDGIIVISTRPKNFDNFILMKRKKCYDFNNNREF